MTQPQVVSCIGVDPGETWGISFLDYIGMNLAGSMQLQVDSNSALVLLETILKTYYADPSLVIGRFAGVEPFVTGYSAGTRGQAAEITRQAVFQAVELLQVWGYHVKTRKAADVKPWAEDKRLKALSIFREPTGMRHANDASRQGLYVAKHDAYRPDPLR